MCWYSSISVIQGLSFSSPQISQQGEQLASFNIRSTWVPEIMDGLISTQCLSLRGEGIIHMEPSRELPVSIYPHMYSIEPPDFNAFLSSTKI